MDPPGHTPYSWRSCSVRVPPGHLSYSWDAAAAPASASAPSGSDREGPDAAAPGSAARQDEQRRWLRQQERRQRRADGTNARLLAPDLAAQLAAAALSRHLASVEQPRQARQALLRRVVIGLGSGRCGTQSLAELFAAQPDCHAEHEMLVGPYMLEWEARQLAGKRCRSPADASDWRCGRVLQQYDVFRSWGCGTAACVRCNFVFRMMHFVLEMMNFSLKMMNLAFKQLLGAGVRARVPCAGRGRWI